MIIESANAATATLKVDPAIILASRQYVDDKFAQSVGPISQTVADLKAEFTTHKADYEYQIPTIENTQIQLTKQSDTNRLLFKLSSDLTGNITISTDNGATSKPLRDIAGNAITQLEKGFTEVVADAAFFTLRSRGISGADKLALIEIVNEAERNESVLKTQFRNAVNAVDTDGGINLPANAPWAEILAQVPNIKTGKKWASGVAHPANAQELIISGIDFNFSIFLYVVSDAYYGFYFNGITVIVRSSTTMQGQYSITQTNTEIIVGKKNTTSSLNPFGNISDNVRWIAIE